MYNEVLTISVTVKDLCTVMHPLLLYIVANAAGNIHRNRVSIHVSIGLTITGKGSSISDH